MILSYFASAYIADAISSTADPADAHGDGSFSLIRCFSIRPPAISIVVSSHIGKSQSITTMTKRTLPRMYVVAGQQCIANQHIAAYVRRRRARTRNPGQCLLLCNSSSNHCCFQSGHDYVHGKPPCPHLQIHKYKCKNTDTQIHKYI